MKDTELTLQQKKLALSFIKDCLRYSHPRVPSIHREGICTILSIWCRFNSIPIYHKMNLFFPELSKLESLRTTSKHAAYWFKNATERLIALESVKLSVPNEYWWYEGFIFYKIGYNNSLGREVIMRRIFKWSKYAKEKAIFLSHLLENTKDI